MIPNLPLLADPKVVIRKTHHASDQKVTIFQYAVLEIVSYTHWHVSTAKFSFHYDDVIMSTIASQITSLTIVYSTVYSGADQSKHQSSASLTGFCVGNSPGTGEFPAQMASNAENVSIWWRHHAFKLLSNIRKLSKTSWFSCGRMRGPAGRLTYCLREWPDGQMNSFLFEIFLFVKLPWIFPGAALIFSGATGNITWQVCCLPE